ncbi:molecular chaperone HscC [Undibacterium sp. SXout20W]|uniref:molecular chaperone HscC n=1 Tax=Undibacterium sp. SXout20W TaxID=3413051 RepID=UPI003BF36904
MIIGIDLGTTNSLVAVWEENGPRLIPNSIGDVLTPSCVSIDADGTVLVGKAARERLQTHPDRSAALFKRYMGSDRIVRIGKKEFRAEELSALILRALKEDAEAYLGSPVTEAVITVPAYFSEAQRKATKAAGKLAGLHVERLLNEPTAAALAYGIHQRDSESKFLVFDLGGGTFDVSVLDLFDGVMEVRATTGDNFLGGEDFVGVINDLFFAANQSALKFKKEAHFMQRLFAASELAKRQLSKEANVSMDLHYDGQQYQLALTEADYEKACASLLVRLRDPVERALRDSNIHPSELDSIVLAGGATRMPIVKRMVSRMFGRFPSVDINPDEVVALGAAVQAGLKMKNVALNEIVMTDVAPYSLGIEISKQLSDDSVSHGHFDPIIERNSVIPVSRVKNYCPISEKQTHLMLNVYQGESRMVRDNIKLGSLKVSLHGGAPENNTVDVRFTYDVNGLLQVEAKTAQRSEPYTLVIEGNPGILSDADITQRLAALADLKIHPRDRLESRTLLAKSERIYQQLLGDEREWFSKQIFHFEQALESQDNKVIAPAKKNIEAAIDHIEQHNRLQPSPDPSW